MKNFSIRNLYLNHTMFKTIIALTGGRVFNMLVSLVLLIIQSRYIGPETTGKVAYFMIPVGFLWILTLGIPSALARELPYFLARGEREKALTFAKTAQSFSIVMGLICSLVFTILAVRALVFGNYFYALGWAFQIINAFFAIYNSYILTLYRTTNEFIKIAKSSTISAITSIVTFPIIFINPFLGLFIRSFSGAITTNIYLYKNRPYKLKFGFDVSSFKKLFHFGIPLILIGYIEANLWTSLQSTLIVIKGSTTHLGLFNFVNQIIMVLLIIPYAVADILRPRFATVYGQTNGNLRETMKSAFKPLILAFLFSLVAVMISLLFLGDIIRLLLPKYVDAIPALEIALFLVPLMTIMPIKYMFVVSKKMKYNAVSTVLGFLLGIVLLNVFLTHNVSFRYIFLPYILGQLLNFLVSVFLLYRASRREG